MAADEFAKEAGGLKVEIVAADHQNKPDLGSAIARRWIDQEGVNTIVDLPNSDLVDAVLPDWTHAERVGQLRAAMAYFNRHGLTSAISAACDPATSRAHAKLRRTGEATLRISAMFAPTGSLNPALSVPEWESFVSRIGRSRISATSGSASPA